MNEKLIEFNQETYLVTTGNLKIVEGNFTKDELSRIYQLRDFIEITNREISNLNKHKDKLKINKQIHKNMPKIRIAIIVIDLIHLLAILALTNFANTIIILPLLVLYSFLQAIVEGFVNFIAQTKKQNEIDEKRINNSLDYKHQQIREYKKELNENIEKTKYHEKTIMEETTIKPINTNVKTQSPIELSVGLLSIIFMNSRNLKLDD